MEIFSNKLRTFITSFGIFLGVASLLSILAMIRGMDHDLQQSLETIGGLDFIKINAKTAETPEEKTQFKFSPGLTMRDGYSLVQRSSYVAAFMPQIDMGWKRVKSGGKNHWCHMQAVGEEHMVAYNYQVEAGRKLTPDDFLQRRRVGIIGKRTAGKLWGKKSNFIGREIIVDHMRFTIVGVIKTGSKRNRRAMELLFPFPVYQAKYGTINNTVRSITIKLHSSDQIKIAEAHIIRQMRQFHRGVDDFELEIAIDKINEKKSTQFALKLILSVIAGICLLSGGVSIMNIMFATIGDRIREIGIRKALGARPADIFTQFLIEAILISFAGGIMGMVVGGGITFLPEGFFPFKPILSMMDYGIAITFTLGVGITAGLFPSFKAAKMQPVDALQF